MSHKQKHVKELDIELKHIENAILKISNLVVFCEEWESQV